MYENMEIIFNWSCTNRNLYFKHVLIIYLLIIIRYTLLIYLLIQC